MFARLFVITLFVSLASCGNHEELKIGQNLGDTNNGQAVDTIEEPVTDLMFSDIYTNIIEPECMVCHSKQKYDEYDAVKKDSLKMLGQILAGSMPRDFADTPDPLPQELRDMFEEWVNAGAPEFGNKDI